MQRDVYRFLLTAIAVLLIIIMCILILRDVGLAERIQEQVWVLCDPESYVTLRSGPGKSKASFGGAPSLPPYAGEARTDYDERTL